MSVAVGWLLLSGIGLGCTSLALQLSAAPGNVRGSRLRGATHALNGAALVCTVGAVVAVWRSGR